MKQQWLEEARQTGEDDTYAGKRQQQRFTWYSQLEVRVTSGTGRTETYLAYGRDISEAGIRFFSRQLIQPGTEATVFTPGETGGVAVVIRHCTQTVNGHLIGADFLD